MDQYAGRHRTRESFTLTGVEHRGGRAGNERLVCFVQGDQGLLVIWGARGQNMRNIQALESSGFPVAIECDWIAPDAYERDHFNHRYWVPESDFLKIVK